MLMLKKFLIKDGFIERALSKFFYWFLKIKRGIDEEQTIKIIFNETNQKMRKMNKSYFQAIEFTRILSNEPFGFKSSERID